MEKADRLGVGISSGYRILPVLLVTIAILLFLLRCSFGIAANPTQLEFANHLYALNHDTLLLSKLQVSQIH